MICKTNYANLRFYEEVNGTSGELFICSECYNKFKEGGADFFEFDTLNEVLYRRKNENKVCPSCGTSLGEFYKTSFLGCSECFDVFRNQIKDILREI
ncbi:MAG: hypothetical protein LBQ40_01585 [Clostridiales bacterium]|nr:hypothetical protein [Clostridiales bacterium]